MKVVITEPVIRVDITGIIAAVDRFGFGFF